MEYISYILWEVSSWTYLSSLSSQRRMLVMLRIAWFGNLVCREPNWLHILSKYSQKERKSKGVILSWHSYWGALPILSKFTAITSWLTVDTTCSKATLLKWGSPIWLMYIYMYIAMNKDLIMDEIYSLHCRWLLVFPNLDSIIDWIQQLNHCLSNPIIVCNYSRINYLKTLFVDCCIVD